MTAKVVEKKRKKVAAKKVVPAHKEAVQTILELDRMPTNPAMQASLVCEMDNRDLWEEMSGGMVPAVLPKIVRVAATLMNAKTMCHFCGKRREPLHKEGVFHFSKEYKLCDCLMVLRKRAHEHIVGWHKPEKLQMILQDVEAGALKPSAPVYQFVCHCGAGPVVINAGLVALSVLKYGSHHRKGQCERCTLKHMRMKLSSQKPMRIPVAEIAAPKAGPQAQLRNRKQGRPGAQRGAVNPPRGSLPPLDVVMTEQQLADLDRQALEKLNAHG